MAQPAVLLILALAAVPGTAGAQWQVMSLAPRTNGSVFRAGECVRLDVLALEAVPGPLAFRATYRYSEPVVIRASDGQEQTVRRDREIGRPAGPPLEGIEAFQSVPVDDRFCFGEASVPGRYEIEVALVAPGRSEPLATLHTCVQYGEPDGASAGCGLAVSGVLKADGPGSMVLDGTFFPLALYRVALLRERDVLALIDGGASVLGPHQLALASEAIDRLGGQSVDLLLYDQSTGTSATLGRVTLPSRQE
jgi:hypothetical protein